VNTICGLSLASVVGRGKRDVVGQMPVALLVHPTEETPRQKKQASYPVSWDSMLEKIHKIVVQDFAQLGVLLASRAAPDASTLSTPASSRHSEARPADHAGGAEQDDFHPWVNSGHP